MKGQIMSMPAHVLGHQVNNKIFLNVKNDEFFWFWFVNHNYPQESTEYFISLDNWYDNIKRHTITLHEQWKYYIDMK